MYAKTAENNQKIFQGRLSKISDAIYENNQEVAAIDPYNQIDIVMFHIQAQD
jgi:hypothetical protein